MIIRRELTKAIYFFLDNFCPPIMRDSYFFMYPIYRIVYGKETKDLFKFKDKFPCLSDEEYREYYAISSKTLISRRPTDLTQKNLDYIINILSDKDNVLDAGCGRGFLSSMLARRGNEVTGLDIEKPVNAEGYTFVKGSIENIPFADEKFDTVICAHVLEHVVNFDICIKELLRVSRKQLIIILPRQREYRLLADLHVRFFPYEYCVRMILPDAVKNAEINLVGGDWTILINKENGLPKMER